MALVLAQLTQHQISLLYSPYNFCHMSEVHISEQILAKRFILFSKTIKQRSMFRSVLIYFVSAVSIAAEVERGERLLLHSDVDTAAAIQMLISQVDNLNAQYGQLNAQYGQLNSQYGQLSAENAQLRTDIEQLKTSNTKGEYFIHVHVFVYFFMYTM